jgi:hypothetical protein
MGTALAVTVVSILVTGFGVFALSSDENILQLTNWGTFTTRVDSGNGDGTKIGEAIYIGLQKVVIVTCRDASDNDYLSWDGCEFNGLFWKDVECGNDIDSFYGYPCDAIASCRAAATDSQFGAFVTAATLIFAMIGCLTRIRKVADTNFQKVVGCIPDTIGVLTQIQALYLFASGCYTVFPEENEDGNAIHLTIGFGYWAYVVCWVCAIIRVTMHYLTPVPGGGAGCHCVDFFEAATGIDWDGDGTKGGRLLGRRSWGKGGVDFHDDTVSEQSNVQQLKVDVLFKPHPMFLDGVAATTLADLCDHIGSDLRLSVGPLQAKLTPIRILTLDEDKARSAPIKWTALSEESASKSNKETGSTFFNEVTHPVSVNALPPSPTGYSWSFTISSLESNEHLLRLKDDNVSYEVLSGSPHAISFSIIIPKMTENIFFDKFVSDTEETNEAYFKRTIIEHFETASKVIRKGEDVESGKAKANLFLRIAGVRAVAKPTLLVVYGEISGFESLSDAKTTAKSGFKYEEVLPLFQEQRSSFASKPVLLLREPCVHIRVELTLEPSEELYPEITKETEADSSFSRVSGPLGTSLDALEIGSADGLSDMFGAFGSVEYMSMGIADLKLPASISQMPNMPDLSMAGLNLPQFPSMTM